MTNVARRSRSEFTTLALSWTGGAAHLDLVETATQSRIRQPVLGRRLAFIVREGRFCIGRYVFVGAQDARLTPCPAGAPAMTGNHCDTCAAQDEFRAIHHVHRGGFDGDSLRAYVEQPHWLYIATFADATSKVGTAADIRKRARLDEQGAVRATYLLRAPDGIAVRHYEEFLSRATDLTQQKRRSSKTSALAAPCSPEHLTATHEAHVEKAAAALKRYDVELILESWAPPDQHADFFRVAHSTAFEVYPHRLHSGSHCLTVTALVGSTALVSVNDGPPVMVADLGDLTGRRITPAPVLSPPVFTQVSLF